MKTFTHKDRSELEIRVAQEIKNHQDWMYEVGQSINLLKEKFVSLSQQQDSLAAGNANDHKSLLIAFENLKESVHKKFTDLVDRIGVVESNLYNLAANFRSLKEDVSEDFIKKESFEEALSNLESVVVSHHLTHTLKNDNFNQYLQQLKGQAIQDLEKLRQDLAPKPSQFDPIKEQVDERFKTWKIDFDGLVKEIALLKKGYIS